VPPQPTADPDYMQGLTDAEKNIVAEYTAEFANQSTLKALQTALEGFNQFAKERRLRSEVKTAVGMAKEKRKKELGG